MAGLKRFLILFLWLDSNLEDTFFFGWEFGAKGAVHSLNKQNKVIFNSLFDGLNC